ncbi:hypothetical protein [Myroides sp. LJL116]
MRNEYLFDLGLSWANTSEGGDLFDIVKPWGEFPTERDNVAFLALIPSNPCDCRFPAIITNFKSICALQIPVNFLPLTKEMLPQNLRSLVLSNLALNGRITNDLIKANKHNWLETNILESMEYLEIRDNSGGGLWGVNHNVFPNLKWLRVGMINSSMLKIINQFSQLEALLINNVGKTNVLDFIPNLDLKILEIKNPLKGFDYKKISSFENLEIIWIWSMKKEQIDCKIFKCFKNLKELGLPYCQRINNVEALLDIPSLVSLHIEDALNLPQEIKSKLEAQIPNCSL